MNKRMFASGALLAIAALGSVSAVAGTHYSASVVVNSTARSAAGHVGDAYNSASTIEMIFCEVRGYETYTHGYCYARSHAGTTLQCNTMKEPVIRAMQAIRSDSKVSFRTDSYGNCASVIVTNGSMYHTKAAPPQATAPSSEPTPGTLTP